MKRNAGKKLTLNRETLTHLENGRLTEVNGGYTARCTEGIGCSGGGGGTSGWFSCDWTICGCESHFCPV